jgi:uncharacterized membrane protein YphA (DoxX/SURF4 family)
MGIPMPGVMGPGVAIFEVVGGLALLAGLCGRWMLAAGILLFLAGSGRAAVDNAWHPGRRGA